jgi:hypothetical protein
MKNIVKLSCHYNASIGWSAYTLFEPIASSIVNMLTFYQYSLK